MSLFIWMAVQTLALALGAMRVPLWARAPEAGEFLAVHILLIVQILSAALLSPRLTSDWRMTTMAIAGSWPFAVLAGLLAAKQAGMILLAGVDVTGWLLVLYAVQSVLEKPRSKIIAAAVIATWVASGPLLLFMRTEYAGGSMPGGPIASFLSGPLLISLRVLEAGTLNQVGLWMLLATTAGIHGGAKWGKLRRVSSKP